jgi:hypothetical protein
MLNGRDLSVLSVDTRSIQFVLRIVLFFPSAYILSHDRDRCRQVAFGGKGGEPARQGSLSLHFRPQFERRWAAQAAGDQGRRSHAQGTDTCTTCGDIVTAPSRSTLLPTGKNVNHWHCSACDNIWDTFADLRLRNANSEQRPIPAQFICQSARKEA